MDVIFKFLQQRYLVIIFIAMGLFNILLEAPGHMTEDSQAIYLSAVKHQYFDHHPPLMAYCWHYLNCIYQGPLLMFLINMALLWTTVYILVFKIFIAPEHKKQRILALFIPFLPWVYIYSGFIWKDVIFALGYGLLAIILAYKAIYNKRFNYINLILFILALLYFTAVKFQAKFILPFIVIWLLQVQFKPKLSQLIIYTVVISYALLQAIQLINYNLITNRGNGSDHAWQYVKIYDLAGMSVNLNKIIIPEFLHKKDNLTVVDLEEKYDLLWEPLINYKDSPLRATVNNNERKLLLKQWQQQVLKHPIAYLQHRINIWAKGLLIASYVKGWLVENFALNNFMKNFIAPIFSIFSYIFILPVQIWLTINIIINKTNKNNKIALYLNLMSLFLLFILLFFSLAAVPRYIYFSFYFFCLSLPFVFAKFK